MSAIVMYECLGDRIQLILPENPGNAISATEMQFWLGASTGRIRDACRTFEEVDPILAEARSEISRLQEENRRLREALIGVLKKDVMKGYASGYYWTTERTEETMAKIGEEANQRLAELLRGDECNVCGTG